jgi:hypothetical protein
MNCIENGSDSRPDVESTEVVSANDEERAQAREVAFAPAEWREFEPVEDLTDAAEVQVLPPKDDASTPEALKPTSLLAPMPATAAVAAEVACEEPKEASQASREPKPEKPVQSERSSSLESKELKEKPKPNAPVSAHSDSTEPTSSQKEVAEKPNAVPVPAEKPPEKATGSGSGGSGTIDTLASSSAEDDDNPEEKHMQDTEEQSKPAEKQTRAEAGKQPIDESVPYDKSRIVMDKTGKAHPGILPSLTKHLTESRRTIHEGEVVKTPEQEQEIHDVNVAVCELAAEVGVDVSVRIPPPYQHHVFDDEEKYRAAATQAGGGETGMSLEACTLPQGIYRRIARDEVSDSAVIVHETLHDVSIQFVQTIIKQNRTVDFKTCTGFNLPRNGMKEFVTDIAMIDVLQRMGKQDLSSYTMLDAVGCALIERAAKFHSIEPMQVYHELLKDMFTGSGQGMALFAQGIGQEAFVEFISLNGEESQEEFQTMAGRFGLFDLQEELGVTHLPGFKAPWEKTKGRAWINYHLTDS